MARRRSRRTRTDPYGKDECQECGKPVIPPTAARYCREHLPTERTCVNCDAVFPWSIRGPGLCPPCYDVARGIEDSHWGDPDWSSGDHLRELKALTLVN